MTVATDGELHDLFIYASGLEEALRAVYNAGLSRAAEIARAESATFVPNEEGWPGFTLDKVVAAIEAEKGTR